VREREEVHNRNTPVCSTTGIAITGREFIIFCLKGVKKDMTKS
jgi:hypothetical protein